MLGTCAIDPAPSRRATACRSATATALKQASATWCGLRPAITVEVERQPPAVGERLEEVGDQGERKLARHPGLLELRRQRPDEVAAPGEIDHGARQRLVERRVGVREAHHATALAERSGEGLAEGDAGVLHRVMQVDVRVSLRRKTQAETGMRRERLQHVSEEAVRHDDRTGLAPVQIQRDLDVRFSRLALEGRDSHRGS